MTTTKKPRLTTNMKVAWIARILEDRFVAPRYNDPLYEVLYSTICDGLFSLSRDDLNDLFKQATADELQTLPLDKPKPEI